YFGKRWEAVAACINLENDQKDLEAAILALESMPFQTETAERSALTDLVTRFSALGFELKSALPELKDWIERIFNFHDSGKTESVFQGLSLLIGESDNSTVQPFLKALVPLGKVEQKTDLRYSLKGG